MTNKKTIFFLSMKLMLATFRNHFGSIQISGEPLFSPNRKKYREKNKDKHKNKIKSRSALNNQT